jgi:hypothetical protein
MSDERPNDDIERYQGGSRRVQTTRDTDDRPTWSTNSGRSSSIDRQRPDVSAGTIAEQVAQSVTGKPVSAEGDSIAATLVGIPRIDLGEFVYEHQLDSDTDTANPRPVALFDIENTSTRPLRWNSSRTTFIGDDEYTYQPAHLSLDPSSLGPGCHTRQVQIEPGRRARMVTLVEQLPGGVEIAEVVHTLAFHGSESERLVFSVK